MLRYQKKSNRSPEVEKPVNPNTESTHADILNQCRGQVMQT